MRKLVLMVAILIFGFIGADAKYLITGSLSQTEVPDQNGMYNFSCTWVNKDCSEKYLPAPTFFELLAIQPEKGNWAEVDVAIQKDKLVFNIKQFHGIERIFFYFPKDLALDPKSSKELGYRNIVLRKGAYDVTYGIKNPLGSVAVDIIIKK